MSATATTNADAVAAGICPRQSFAAVALPGDDSTQKNRYGCELKLEEHGGLHRGSAHVVLGGFRPARKPLRLAYRRELAGFHSWATSYVAITTLVCCNSNIQSSSPYGPAIG